MLCCELLFFYIKNIKKNKDLRTFGMIWRFFPAPGCLGMKGDVISKLITRIIIIIITIIIDFIF